MASKDKSAYVAAKHGVIGLSKTLALETARTGVTCNAICPGWVLTPLVQQQIDKRIAEGCDPHQPANSCWRKSSPPASLSPRNSWVNWRCFSVVKVQPRCAVRHGTWTAAGSRNNRQPAQEAPFLLSSPHFPAEYFLPSVYFRQKTMSSGYLFNNDVWFQAIKSGRKSYVRSKRCQKPP